MTDRADEIVTSEDFPFETTVCPECGVRHSDIPALMKAAEQIRAYGDERVGIEELCCSAINEMRGHVIGEYDLDVPFLDDLADAIYAKGRNAALEEVLVITDGMEGTEWDAAGDWLGKRVRALKDKP